MAGSTGGLSDVGGAQASAEQHSTTDADLEQVWRAPPAVVRSPFLGRMRVDLHPAAIHPPPRRAFSIGAQEHKTHHRGLSQRSRCSPAGALIRKARACAPGAASRARTHPTVGHGAAVTGLGVAPTRLCLTPLPPRPGVASKKLATINSCCATPSCRTAQRGMHSSTFWPTMCSRPQPRAKSKTSKVGRLLTWCA